MGRQPDRIGPFMSGDMLMHNYSQNGTYVIEYLAVEVDPHTGLICFEKVIRDTFTLNCGDCSCEDIHFTVQPISNNIDVCCYRLIVQNTSDSCFDKISIQVDAGLSILNPSLNFPGWTVVPTAKASIDLFPPASFVPIGSYIPLTFCVTGGTVHNIVVFTYYTTPAASYECPTFFTFECDKMGDCPNNLVVNGNFEMGTPPGGDEGIGFATAWSGIWPAEVLVRVIFTIRYFRRPIWLMAVCLIHCPHHKGDGAFWSKPHGTNQIWREGIMGSLTAPILPNTGCYELKAKIACITKPLLPYAGTVYPVINVYGAHTGVGNTYPGFRPDTRYQFACSCVARVIYAGCYLRREFPDGSYFINTAASSGLPLTAAGFDRIFFTRADGVFSSVVVAMDDICLLPAPCPVEECACKPGASIQLIYDNVTQWLVGQADYRRFCPVRQTRLLV